MLVAAVDLGYGHTKYGYMKKHGKLFTGSFPSIAEAINTHRSIPVVGFEEKDLITVSVQSSHYVVGKDIIDHCGFDARDLHADYPKTPGYQALMLGALHYLNQPVIDMLVLGLPVNNLFLAKALSKRWKGVHKVGRRTIEINKVLVVPQPLGGLLQHFDEQRTGSAEEVYLAVDSGYLTLDWIVVRGTRLNESRSGTHEESMRACLRSMCDAIAASIRKPYKDYLRVEQCLRQGERFRVANKTFHPDELFKVADPIIGRGIRLLAESVGSVDDIKEIVLIGGASSRFRDQLASRFKPIRIRSLKDPQFANIKGYLLMGQRIALIEQQKASRPCA